MPYCFLQLGDKGFSGDGAGAQAGKVGGGYLAIDESEVACLQVANQVGQAYFGGVAHGGEHGFSEESLAKGNAVEAADQLVVVPGFDGMGVAVVVQGAVGGFHFSGDPGSGAPVIAGGLGAGVDHLLEGGIDGDLE